MGHERVSEHLRQRRSLETGMVLMRYLLFWAALLPAFDVGLSLFNLGRMVEPDCSFHSHLLARGAGLGPRGACALRNAGTIKCGGVGGVHIGDIVLVTDHEYEWLSMVRNEWRRRVVGSCGASKETSLN